MKIVELFEDSKSDDTIRREVTRRWVNHPAFMKWFSGSKIVDAAGDPLLVFHGSPNKITSFEPSDVGGFFFTPDHNYAANHVIQFKGYDSGHLHPSFLSIKNPKTVTPPDDEFSVLPFERELIRRAKEEGHDGLILRGKKNVFYVAFVPSQIKSIHNKGDFGQSSNIYEDVEQPPSPTTIQWKSPRNSDNFTAVWIDVSKLDASWKLDRGFYISAGGGGDSIKGRYERFGEWIKEGHPVEMPEVCLNEWRDCISFTNGRHRFRWLADHGLTAMPVCVPVEQADEIKKRFGTSSRISQMKQQPLDEISMIPSSNMNESAIRFKIRLCLSIKRRRFGKIGDITISFGEDGRDQYFIFGKDKIAQGFAILQHVVLPGVNGYYVSEIGLLDELRYEGNGLKFYHVLLDKNYTLFSGGSQTKDSRNVWRKLMADPTVDAKVIDLGDPEATLVDAAAVDPWSEADLRIIVRRTA